MASPVAIRLDSATRQRITRLARAKRKTASQVMREAIETGLQQQETAPVPPYELISGLIGVVHSGDPAGSTNMGRKFTQLLKNRRGRT
jgi:hypothetical protein